MGRSLKLLTRERIYLIMNLVVVGPTQSGKTCLAVGLASTNTKIDEAHTLVVTPRGDTVNDYISERKKKFADSEWPETTTETTLLHFDINWDGKSFEAFFNDYMGETTTSPDFLKKLSDLGKNDGVILLVNPGFKCPYVKDADGKFRLATEDDKKAGMEFDYAYAFRDNHSFAEQWLIEQENTYAQIIERLRTRNGASKEKDMPVVAVVVTASDRLEEGKGDLSDCCSRFEEFLNKITIRLSEFDHETYRVSVTGHLEDQMKPKLADGAENTSSEPFLKVIQKLEERKEIEKEEMVKEAARIQAELEKEKKKKALMIVAGGAIVATLCVGAYELVRSNRDQTSIASWHSSCLSALGKNGLRIVDLKKVVGQFNLLKSHNGYHKKAASTAADKIEPSIWKEQKNIIDRKIQDIADSQGKMGSPQDLAEVDDLFAVFKPTVKNLVAEYKSLHESWSQKKDELRDAHQAYEFREGVEKPLRNTETIHGISAMDKLYPIADTIGRLSPAIDRLVSVKEDLAKKVDVRISEEWRNFAIPSFQKTACSNATEHAVKAFQRRLADWAPASPSGEEAKSNLVAFVLTNIPIWRMTYETKTFSSEMGAVVKNNGSMESLAKFYPSRVATNEFLTTEFVKAQWEKRAQPVFEREYHAYLDGIVAKSARGSAPPVLTDECKTDIERRATRVGAPFDPAKALAYVETHVKKKAQEWESAKRDECKKWITDKVRPGRSRTGRNSLWDDYDHEKRRSDNPFFVEIVGLAVYREVERWFESDVAVFQKELASPDNLIWLDGANFAVRYKELAKTFNEFKKTCDRINEDKNPPSGTWAHRFAELCVTQGRVQDGMNRAFLQRIKATRLYAMIDYEKFPFNYKWTAVAAWFEIEGFENNGAPLTDSPKQKEVLIASEGEHAPNKETTAITKDKNRQYVEVWSAEKICEAGFFQRTKFVVRVTDYNKGNRFKKTSDITKVVSFVDKKNSLELDGQLHIGRWTGASDVPITASLTVEMSGETPFTLLAQAKQDMSNRMR